MRNNTLIKPCFSNSSNDTEAALAFFRSFSASHSVNNAGGYFWENYTEIGNYEKNIQSCVNLVHKEFNLPTGKKYKVRSGYLRRFNYLKNPIPISIEEEIKKAIGKEKNREQQRAKKYGIPLQNFVIKELVKEITSFKKPEKLIKEELLHFLDAENTEHAFLRSIIGRLPGHVYWVNRNNVYVGCNDKQAESFGIKSREEIRGKTNDDLLPAEEAAQLNLINKQVMETGVPYEGEETASFGKNHKGHYLSQKVPLRDPNGKIIGLLGMSIDITDRKRADRKRVEELELQNKMQNLKIEQQEEFRIFTARIAHDIASPLVCLETFLNSCPEISEKNRVVLRGVVKSVKNISSTLLAKYKKDKAESYAIQEQFILVSLALEDIVTHKKYQYNNSLVTFNYSYNSENKFTFLRGDQSSFERMVSNLINNAVEAFEGGKGTVNIGFEVNDDNVYITIQDTGKGMPADLLNKIKKYSSVETTKKEGHGIGLGQVIHTLKLYKGKWEVESEEGKGTQITLIFPLRHMPPWAADKIRLRKGDTIVILDDDSSMFSVWENVLDKYKEDLTLKFFTTSYEAINFIFSINKEKAFLLSDYDLRDDSMSGLTTILQCGMKERSLMATSIHNDKYLQDLLEQSQLKMIPKQLLLDIPVILES